MNIQQTNGRSVTESLPGLLVRRNRVGAESREGRLLSNLIQQIRNYQREEDPVARVNLERFMGWQLKLLAKGN